MTDWLTFFMSMESKYGVDFVKMLSYYNSQCDWRLYVPRDHNNKIHDIPHVPEVGVLVENESHSHYLGAHLDSEDSLQYHNLNALKSFLFLVTIKTGSNSSSWRERMVLSLLAILLSIDMTTQLDMMVMIINHSNGGQVTNQTNKRLKQLKNQYNLGNNSSQQESRTMVEFEWGRYEGSNVCCAAWNSSQDCIKEMVLAWLHYMNL